MLRLGPEAHLRMLAHAFDGLPDEAYTQMSMVGAIQWRLAF